MGHFGAAISFFFLLVQAAASDVLKTGSMHFDERADGYFNKTDLYGDNVALSERRRLQNNRYANIPIQDRPLIMEAGDLNIRFSKIPFTTGIGEKKLPFRNRHYPIRGSSANLIKRTSIAESVMTSKDPALRGRDVLRYIEEVGGAPSFPNADPNHVFWTKDFKAVVDSQSHRRRNGSPQEVMTLPNLWRRFDISEVAEAVNDEYPGLWQGRLLEQFIINGVRIDYDILPFRSLDDFIGRNFRMAELNMWSTMQVAAVNFRTKWTFGRPRPEEVAWLVNTGKIQPQHVPADILKTIKDWNLRNAFEFTAYTKKGSPRHPSYPAMHSAASSSSLWMAIVFDLTPEQYCEALRMDYAVSYARTVAGVHYPTDNIAGLNMGQSITADFLPGHLRDRFKSKIERVQAKVRKFRFDWNDFDPVTCSTRPTVKDM